MGSGEEGHAGLAVVEKQNRTGKTGRTDKETDDRQTGVTFPHH